MIINRYLFPLLFSLLAAGCGKNKLFLPKQENLIAMEFHNSWTNKLNGVRLEDNNYRWSVGLLSPNVSATLGNEVWVNQLSADLIFDDFYSGHEYSVKVDLSAANEAINNGQCQKVVFLIINSNKVDVVCHKGRP